MTRQKIRSISPNKPVAVCLRPDSTKTAVALGQPFRYGLPSQLHTWWATRPMAVVPVVSVSPLFNEDDSHKGQNYIRRPFDREPGWGVSSINYNLSDLLQKAESR